jgi:hypothetical protein
MLPSALTSLKSAAYRALAGGGGPAGRNWDGERITHGVMRANCSPAPGRNCGGVGRHSPTAFPPTNGGGGVNPSVLLQASVGDRD